ncbi:MAG: hypothetical protein R2851_20855 [Caldilineaceae bacterium]
MRSIIVRNLQFLLFKCAAGAIRRGRMSVLAQSGGDYELTGPASPPGGMILTGGDYSLESTIGRPESGVTQRGGDYTLTGGMVDAGGSGVTPTEGEHCPPAAHSTALNVVVPSGRCVVLPAEKPRLPLATFLPAWAGKSARCRGRQDEPEEQFAASTDCMVRWVFSPAIATRRNVSGCPDRPVGGDDWRSAFHITTLA